MTVYCSLCSDVLPEVGEKNAHLLADKKVYKLGELAYIELAHRACAIEDGGRVASWDYNEGLVL